jgi:hypothetical protein
VTRTPIDRPAGVIPVASAGPATSPNSTPQGGVAASGLPDLLPLEAGRPDAPQTPAYPVYAPAGNAGRTPAAGTSAAAKLGKVTSPRPAAGFHLLAAKMSEAELEEHVRAICKDLGVVRIHVYNSRGTTPGVPDDILVGPRGILWRELKTAKGKLTLAQQEMGRALVAAGQNWGVWRPSLLLSGVIAKELAAISRIGRAA